MKWWPKSLFGQLLLTMVAVLFVVQIAGLVIMWSDRSELASRLSGYHAAQRISGMISLLDAESPENRQELIDALSVPPVEIDMETPWQPMAKSSIETNYFEQQLTEFLNKPYNLHVATVTREKIFREPLVTPSQQSATSMPPMPMHGHRMRGHMHMNQAAQSEGMFNMVTPPWGNRRPKRLITTAVVQVQLSDGELVTFRHDLRRDSYDLPLRVIALLGLLGLSVGVLAIWAVRRLTRPLKMLSNAAIKLGKNIDSPPLPETGPSEIASAAGAFNTMQREIKNLLNTRSQTLAALSHDLRLPITRVRLRLEKVDDPELKAKLEDDLADIDCMVENTLAFLRAGKSREGIAPINMNALIDSIADDMSALGGVVNVHGNLASPVTGQPSALRRCLNNLIDNARRYSQEDIDVTLTDGSDHVTIVIEDRGPGVPDSEKERIFEPYVRLETSRARHTGGTGLGLAIARAIAKSHGGNVELADREGGGLKVIVTISRIHPDSMPDTSQAK